MDSDRDMYRHFQDWCLRTYGDSGKTKTVTRKKYERIVQLLNGSESSSTDNAKFKFWVKSKGFQLGTAEEGSLGDKQVLYVPVKTTVSACVMMSMAGMPPPCPCWVQREGGFVLHLSLFSSCPVSLAIVAYCNVSHRLIAVTICHDMTSWAKPST